MGRPKGSKNKTTDDTTATDAAQIDDTKEYPFLKEPAEPGAVIIGTTEHESTRPMTEADVREAHDDLYKESQKLRTEALTEKELTLQIKSLEASLKGAREDLRKSEEEQLVLGRRLATFAEEIHTGVRKIEIKVVESITKGNEYVVTDARNGSVIERRTATTEEIEESRGIANPSAQSSMSTMTSTMAADDSVLISLSTAAYKKTKKAIKDGLTGVEYPNQVGDPDADVLGVLWDTKGNRSVAEVPRWAADRLKKIADGDKALDFKIGDLAKVIDKLEKAADAVIAEVL